MKRFLILFFLFSTVYSDNAIKGFVKDNDNNPMASVKVSIKGNNNLTAITDANGYYEITVTNTSNKQKSNSFYKSNYSCRYNKNKLYLNVGKPNTFTIELFSSNGKKLFTNKQFVSNNATVDLPLLGLGMYVLRITNNNKSRIVKLNSMSNTFFKTVNRTSNLITANNLREEIDTTDTLVLEKNEQLIEEIIITDVDSLLSDTLNHLIKVYGIMSFSPTAYVPTNVKAKIWTSDTNLVSKEENIWIVDTVNYTWDYWDSVRVSGSFELDACIYIPQKYMPFNYKMTLEAYKYGKMIGFTGVDTNKTATYVPDTISFVGDVDSIQVNSLRFDNALPVIMTPNKSKVILVDTGVIDTNYSFQITVRDKNTNGRITKIERYYFNGNDSTTFGDTILTETNEVLNDTICKFAITDSIFNFTSIMREYNKGINYKIKIHDDDGNVTEKSGAFYVVNNQKDYNNISLALIYKAIWKINNDDEVEIIRR